MTVGAVREVKAVLSQPSTQTAKGHFTQSRFGSLRVSVVIPALNEERSLPLVLGALPMADLQQVVVADNGSEDGTARVAREGGAEVVLASRRGYGSACLSGMASLNPADIVVFLDADFSDDPTELPLLVEPILDGRADLVVGSRSLGDCEKGAMMPQQRFGNWLATRLVALFFGHRYTDLGPFRAVTAEALDRIAMGDLDFGWTIEMQVRALQEGLRVEEVPVSYRRRIGVSKITGTVKGTFLAGVKILWTIFRLRLRGPAS
ncbi:MAG: glycosyltransferase family 2 protein [Planctomycetota bacterium]|nr:glycosyltransferase family 2 protein [Planctomycetota bacterium]